MKIIYLNRNINNNLTIIILIKMSVQESNTFYLYTTGIADWCELNKTFGYWTNELSRHVFNSIPLRFTRIIITHSDILDDFNGIMSMEDLKKNQTIQEINTQLQLEYTRDSRIVSSNFQTTPLDFEQIRISNRVHLIIDFAHVFVDYSNIPYGLNVVYLGYVGEHQIIENNMCTRYIKNFFQVNLTNTTNTTNTIHTYINKLSDTNRFSPLKQDYPPDNIRDIMKKIRKNLGLEFKKIYGDYTYFDSIFNEANIPTHSEIVDIIMDKIMDTEDTEDTIVTNIVIEMKTRFLS